MNTNLRERIDEVYNAYLEGHFQYLVDEVVDDEIDFATNAPTHAFPYLGPGKGKDALLATWKAFRLDYEFLSYTPFLVVAETADTAFVVVKMKVMAIATGRVMALILADYLRFRDDRVVKFRQTMDPCEASELWLGREIAG
jgi:hypothetical protein